MIERKESGQSPDEQDPKSGESTPGSFLKEVNEDTDLDAGEINDKSTGMGTDDYLGKSNLRNRDEDSPENA